MTATILEILSKQKLPFSGTKLQDFDYTQGEEISLSALPIPRMSLYCLDHPRQEAIFVETPPDIDIYSSPFIRNTQFEYAQRLIAVPYVDLYKIASYIKDPNERLIIIHYVSRCGSTLLCNIFDQIKNIVSISEIDILSHICDLKQSGDSSPEEIKKMLQSCIRICCNDGWRLVGKGC